MAEPSEWAKPGSLRGRCQGCGEIVEIDQDGYSHTRPEHDPACDGSCTIGCPVPVLCGPVTLVVPPVDPLAGRVAPDVEAWLAKENRLLRAAGCALAEAALRVIQTSDGVHRLALAVSRWASTVANEGGRAARTESAAANGGREQGETDAG